MSYDLSEKYIPTGADIALRIQRRRETADRQRRFLLKAQLVTVAISTLAVAAFFLFASCASAPPVEAPDPVAERLGDLLEKGDSYQGNTPCELDKALYASWGVSDSAVVIRKIDRETKVMALKYGNFPKCLTTIWQGNSILYFVPSPHVYTPGEEDLLKSDYMAALSLLREEFENLEPRYGYEEWEEHPTMTGVWVKDFDYAGKLAGREFAQLACFSTTDVNRYIYPELIDETQSGKSIPSAQWVIGLIVCFDAPHFVYRILEEKDKLACLQDLVNAGRSIDFAVSALTAHPQPSAQRGDS